MNSKFCLARTPSFFDGPISSLSHKWIGSNHSQLQIMDKIKPLFTNVFLSFFNIGSKQTAKLRILLGHLLPMVASICGICCDNDGVRLLEQHYPGTLALAKELELSADPASIPAYLDWMSVPLDFDQYAPKFLIFYGKSETIHAIVEAVRTV